MSEDNICNYCKLEAMRRDACQRGKYIRVRVATGKLKGINVYETPDVT